MSRKEIVPFAETSYLALGHFVTDLYPAFLPPLLPLLIEKFQISITRVSLLATVLTLSASLTQPLFGFLFDRIGGRKMIIFGPVIGGLSLSLIGLAPRYSILVVLLILGGLGAASYHPEAAALTASLSGGKRTFGMSIFMLGGNLGFSLGPFLILAIVTSLGLEWTFLASIPAFGLAWLLHKRAPLPEALRVSSTGANLQASYDPNTNALSSSSSNRRNLGFGILFSVVLFRVTTVLSLFTFLPILQKLRGFSLVASGSSVAVFMGCGALGGLIGGYIADRLGRKKIILASLIVSIPVFLAFFHLKGPISFFILALLGFLFFLSEPSCIVMAQEMAPQKTRTASGLIMGMAWGMAGCGVLATGTLADAIGFEWALRSLLLLPAGAVLLSFFLPTDRR
jgi:MFS transporter, FSR family, fosmidomycin resistance protein